MTEKHWHQAAYVAVVVTAGALIFQLFMPLPKLGKVVEAKRKEQIKLEKDIETLRDEVTTLRARNSSLLWAEPADQVSAKAMQRVTDLAKANDLKLIAFRPQRSDEGGGVSRHPYQISLDGYFPKVMTFIRALETPKLKLPVITLQVASADGASDRVTATVGIVAFRELTTKKP